ncbi:hypothetical protein E4U55_004936 [Claviceps digitariae]|nr:hypothetical protein E4U55_004936 [Claviceps digitariae]
MVIRRTDELTACNKMLSFRGTSNACARSTLRSVQSLSRCSVRAQSTISNHPSLHAHTHGASAGCPPRSTRRFSTSRSLGDKPSIEQHRDSVETIEKVVRDAKQRFRDTLPRGYLNKQEYALYERLYGPPLRETEPEDVGIPTHADMGDDGPGPDDMVLVSRLQDGEVGAKWKIDELSKGSDVMQNDTNSMRKLDSRLVKKAPGYVDIVARNQREHDALKRLAQDFEAAQALMKSREDEAAAGQEEEEQQMQAEEQPYWPPEQFGQEFQRKERETGEHRRFHRYTLEGRFHGSPVEISLPKEEFILPIRELLKRTHVKHVREAAETAFGGQGLPRSPSTPWGLKNSVMGGVGLPPDQRHMTEIEADAFLAGYLPPAYASIAAVLREVRKRVGSDWIQSRLKGGPDGGLSVLDAGAGGAGLVAWEQIARAEWDLLKENGQVSGLRPEGKKAVVVGSDRLRYRLKNLLDNTTFLPRLPDYEHSGEMQGNHLDAGSKPQTRKSFDVIIASHLFLKEKQDHYRQAILNNLWSLLNKDGGVLIVMEKAHPRGFEAVAHVRETVLKQFLLPQDGEEPRIDAENFNPAFHRELEQGHIIAPCSNHGTCPMYTHAGKSAGRKDYCHFSQRFVQPQFYTQMLRRRGKNQGEVEFSYVAFRRGVARSSSGSGSDAGSRTGTMMTSKEATERAFEGFEHSKQAPDMHTLPRLILPPLKRKGHVTLDLCTSEGNIERWTVPKSLSKLAYHDARKSKWGDLWALGAKTRVPRNIRVGAGPDDGGRRAAAAVAAARGGKKAHKADIAADRERLTASEKNALRERRPKGKAAKHRELMKEMFAVEAKEEALLDLELEEEAEGELDERGRWVRR